MNYGHCPKCMPGLSLEIKAKISILDALLNSYLERVLIWERLKLLADKHKEDPSDFPYPSDIDSKISQVALLRFRSIGYVQEIKEKMEKDIREHYEQKSSK